MNIITLNRVLLNNTPLNYRRKRILTEKDFYFKTIERTFTFSKSAGGKSIKDGRAYIKRIKGNSVVWNQMNESPDFSMLNSFSAVGGASHTSANGVLSVTLGASNYSGVVDASIYSKLQVNHTYLFITRAKANTTLNNVAIPYTSSYIISSKNTLTTSYQTFAKIFKVTANSTTSGPCRAGEVGTDFNAGDVIDVNMYCVIDLTKMFQAGNEPTTIEEFNARVATLGVDLYAYNEGEVIHCNTESIKSVGDNAWDEVVELGSISSTSGENIPNDNAIRPKNYIKILPNEQYHINVPFNEHIIFYDERKQFLSTLWQSSVKTFTTPSNAAYMRFRFNSTYGTTYNHDIMITLVHSGWKQDTDAGYQPYWQDTLPLPIIRKYFPDGMKSAGSAHDEIRFNKASGKWEYSKGKIKSVDLGNVEWLSYQPNGTFNVFYTGANPFPAAYSNFGTNVVSQRYVAANKGASDFIDRECRLFMQSDAIYPRFYIRDDAYTDAASFKAAMAGVILYYEAAEWEWVELDVEDQNFRDYYNVADFGTEQAISTTPSAALLADVGYYFKKSEVKELTLN